MIALRAFIAAAVLLALAGCGGGGGSGSQPPPQPQPLRIVTTSVPQGTTGQGYSAQFEATGGSGAYNWSLAGGTLPSGLSLSTQSNQAVIAGNLTQTGDFPFTIAVHDSSTPPKSATADFTLKVIAGLRIVTASLAPASVNAGYSELLRASGGTPPYIWEIATGLPPGLYLNSVNGEISGTPTAMGSYPLAITVRDSQSTPSAASTNLTLLVVATAANRNDSVATATVVPFDSGQASFQASISPYADPPDVARPDVDYYRVTAAAGAVVIVEVDPLPGSAMDPVVEVVDGSGGRFATCRDLAADNPPPDVPVVRDPTPNAFDDACINDDRTIGGGLNSYLEFQVPGTAGTAVTFYIKVFDWRGDSRPDLLYQLTLQRQ